MRVSNYSTEIKLDDGNYMLYNTISREYFICSADDKEKIKDVISLLDERKSYTTEEIALLKTLFQKGIIVDNDVDELKKLEFLENSQCFQNSTYHITIFSTNACNFRCVYCTQDHIVKNIEEDVIENIVKLVEKISKHIKLLCLTWFGGEPLLQFDKIRRLTMKIIEICKKNQCDVYTDFVTNGFLLEKEIVGSLCDELNTKSIQITVDATPEIHNKRRHLANGDGTYNKILKNIIKVLQRGMKVILRINIDEETFLYPIKILEDIPYEYRELVTISISNLFQNKDRRSAYGIFKEAIELGYQYGERRNDYYGCKTSGNKNIVIDTNGEVLFCTNTDSKDGIVGKLNSAGNIVYFERDKYRQNLMNSARDNKACKECIELPFCIGRCRLTRIRRKNECLGRCNVGLTLEERAKLDYLYDRRCVEA